MISLFDLSLPGKFWFIITLNVVLGDKLYRSNFTFVFIRTQPSRHRPRRMPRCLTPSWSCCRRSRGWPSTSSVIRISAARRSCPRGRAPTSSPTRRRRFRAARRRRCRWTTCRSGSLLPAASPRTCRPTRPAGSCPSSRATSPPTSRPSNGEITYTKLVSSELFFLFEPYRGA